MKVKLLLSFSLLIFSNHFFSQAPSWLWAKNPSGSSVDQVNAIATDASGNVYATGFYDGPATAFGTTTLTNSTGWRDVFVTKYNSAGNPIWAVGTGGNGNGDREGLSIAIDANGNSYISGYFNTSNFVIGTTTLTNSGQEDIFIAKFDPNGNPLWAKKAGGSSYDRGVSITTDPSGNVFLTGYFLSNSVTFGTYTLSSATGQQMFTVKYDTNGNVLWAHTPAATSGNYARCVVSDASGNAYVCGNYGGLIQFGTNSYIPTDGIDYFIVKYGPSGNILWSTSDGHQSFGICLDASNNLFITGSFNTPTLAIGSNTFTNTGTGDDIFIAKYNSTGNVAWAKSAGGSNVDAGFGVSADANGNVYMMGQYASSVIAIGTSTLSNAGPTGTSWDLFIAGYSASGNPLWATSINGNKSELVSSGKCISVNAAGNIFIGGAFASSTVALGTTTLTNSGPANVFDNLLAKMGSVTLGESEISPFNSDVFQIFPNPAEGKFHLTLPPDGNSCHIIILNSLGQTVFQQKTNNLINETDISLLPKGIYYVHVTDEQSHLSEVKKLIIQ